MSYFNFKEFFFENGFLSNFCDDLFSRT